MAVELASAYISLIPSAKGLGQSIASELGGPLEREAKKAGEKASSGFGASFKSGIKTAATGLGAAFGAAAVVQGIGKMTGAASALNETVSRSNTIFGSNAGAIEKWASGAATAFGQSKAQALESAASFGNMFTQLGIGTDTAAGMSKQMTELASDFAAFHNADITQVLEAQQAAFRGEYDAVQRFVPTINAAAVEQRALEMGLAASTAALDAQDKALATQALFMEGAGAAAGAYARESDGLAGQQRELSARWGDMQAQLGQKLIPVLSATTGVMLNQVIPAFESAGGILAAASQPVQLVAEHWDSLKYVVAAGAAVMVPHFAAIGAAATLSGAKQVAAWTATQAAGIGAAVAHSAQVGLQVAKWAWLGIQSTLHAAKVAAAWIIAMGPIAIATAAVVGLGVVIVKNWDKIKETIDAGWQFVKRITTETWDGIKAGVSTAVDGMVGFFTGLPGRIIDTITSAGSALLDVGKTMVEKIVEGIKSVAGDIGSAILGAIPGGGAIGKAIGAINPFNDGEGMSSGGGSFGGVRVTGRTVAGGTWRQLVDMVAATGVAATASSVFRPGAITRSGNPSYHGMGRAVDLVGNLGAIQAALQRYGPFVKELIGPNAGMNWRNGRPHRYNSAVQRDHYDHVHFAAHRGEFIRPESPGWEPYLARDERLRVVQVGETITPKGADAGSRRPIQIDNINVHDGRNFFRELEIQQWLYGSQYT